MADPLAEIKARREASYTVKPPPELGSMTNSPRQPFPAALIMATWIRIIKDGKPWDQAPLPVRIQEFLEHAPADIDLLIGEVEQWRQAAAAEADLADERNREVARLRGLLGHLEWAGQDIGADEREPVCPVCHAPKLGDGVWPPDTHEPDCWLTAAIRPTSPDPPAVAT